MINRNKSDLVESKEKKETNPSLSIFKDQDPAIKKQANELYQILLLSDRMIVGYKPYPEQSGLKNILEKSNPLASQVLKKFMQEFDVNVFNRFGLTILHNLMWHERPDLAKILLADKTFDRINFKFAIPMGLSIMYASALDLAISMHLGKKPGAEEGFDLDFISLLLKNGATPPNPTKKFLDAEFISVIFPAVVEQTKHGESTKNIISLLELMHCYGFSVEKMETEFNKRLFLDDAHSEFTKEFSVTKEEQESILKSFFTDLKAQIAKSELKKELVVTLTPDRLETGKDMIDVPEAQDPPCCIM